MACNDRVHDPGGWDMEARDRAWTSKAGIASAGGGEAAWQVGEVTDLTVDDAVYCIALRRYVAERQTLGERPSLLAAAKVAAIARVLGVEPVLTARELGFAHNLDAPAELIALALSRVARGRAQGRVNRLYAAVSGLPVADVEAYMDRPGEPRTRRGSAAPATAKGDGTATSGGQQLHNAVYAAALHRYVVDRTQAGERVTVRAAMRVADLAEALGMRPTRDLAVLAFRLDGDFLRPLSHDDLWQAMKELDGAARQRWLRPLCDAFEDLSVAELERLELGGA